MMDKQECIQAKQYSLPYHNIPWLFSWEHQLEYEVYLEYMVAWVGVLKPKSILDVGCGDGRFLREVGFGVGVDMDEKAVTWAKAFGVEAYCQDAVDMEGKFDLVTAIEVLEHVKEESKFIETLVARADKDILIMVPSATLPVSAKHYRHYTAAQLMDLVRPHINIKGIYHLVYQPKWWTILEKLHFRWMGNWLKHQLAKRILAEPGKERHILLWGSPR